MKGGGNPRINEVRQMKRTGWILLAALCLAALTACGGGGGTENAVADRETEISAQLTYVRSLEPEFAREFAVDYYRDGYALLTVGDGRRYLVVPEQKEIPEDLPEDVILLQRPIQNVYLVASAAMDMVCALDALPMVCFSGQKAENWCIPEAKAAMEEGTLSYAGKYNMPDYELLVSGHCGIAIENSMILHSPAVVEKLESFGIPVLVDRASYETHPLGRVEWILVYGLLFDREEEAAEVVKAQKAVVERVKQEDSAGSTVAFFYITANGSVNVRRSSDYVPRMIELAGGTYVFSGEDDGENRRSTVNMQQEEFYRRAREADYLIYNSTIGGAPQSLEELLDEMRPLEDFKAVKEGKVWCTTQDLYQQSLSAGGMIEDLHAMLAGETEALTYLYPLK